MMAEKCIIALDYEFVSIINDSYFDKAQKENVQFEREKNTQLINKNTQTTDLKLICIYYFFIMAAQT